MNCARTHTLDREAHMSAGSEREEKKSMLTDLLGVAYMLYNRKRNTHTVDTRTTLEARH